MPYITHDTMASSHFITHNPTTLPFMTPGPRMNLLPSSSSNSAVAGAGRKDSAATSQEEQDLTRLIHASRPSLLHFLYSFLSSNNPAGSTASSAEVIKTYLSASGTRTVTISPPGTTGHHQPGISSLIDSAEDGPCLVMAGLIPVSDPTSSFSSTSPPSTTKTNTAAITAAFSILHAFALQDGAPRIPGTIVLVAASEDEAGSYGNLTHLLYEDDRRCLFRGDCVLAGSGVSSSSSLAGDGRNEGSFTSSCARDEDTVMRGDGDGAAVVERGVRGVHPLQVALDRRAARFFGGKGDAGTTVSASGVSSAARAEDETGRVWTDGWQDLGIPVCRYGINDSGGVDRGTSHGARVAAGGLGKERSTSQTEDWETNEQRVDEEAFVRLVMVYALAAWDYMRAF